MVNQCVSQAHIGQELRLDPCHLPQSVAYQHPGRQKNICVLAERGVSFSMQQAGKNAPLAHVVPIDHFKGVGAQMVLTNDDNEAVSLVLLHENPDFNVPLLVSQNFDDVILDWRLWADTYDLPMFIIRGDSSVAAVKEQSPLRDLLCHKKHKHKQSFMVRCRGLSLGLKLVMKNQVMFG